MSTTEAKVVLSVVDRITAPIAAIQRRIDRLTAPIRNISRGLADISRAAGINRVAGEVGNLGRRLADTAVIARGLIAPLAAIGAVTLGLGAKQLIDVNSQFEKFGTVLETVMKSPEKAKASLAWISDFAVKTPYELSETTDAFVKLTTYGIDPIKGALMSAGNAAAAMGKPLNQAVEAVADAMTGENERLKEFGITAEKEKNKVIYTWTEAGKQMRAIVRKGSREQALLAITGIWNRQYEGAMDKLSRTWDGMTSNLSDQWARFMLAIGKAGTFDYIKGRLDSLLKYMDGLASSGRLDSIAKNISTGIVDALKAIEDAVRGLDWSKIWEQAKSGWEVVKGLGRAFMWFADLVGGPVQGALLILGSITLAPLVTAIMSVIPALWALSVALWTTPFGLFVIGATAIAGAAKLIYDNWAGIKEFFVGIWDGLPEGFKTVLTFFYEVDKFFIELGIKIVKSLWDGAAQTFGAFAEWLTGALRGILPEWALNKLGLNVTNAQKNANFLPAPTKFPTFNPLAGRGGTQSGVAPTSIGRSQFQPFQPQPGFMGMGAGARGQAWPVSPAAPLGVPVVTGAMATGQPDVSVNAPMSLEANFHWASTDPVLAAVRALLLQSQAQSEARIRAALTSNLSD